MPSPTEISVPQLSRLVGLPDAPSIIDVRATEHFDADPTLIPASLRRDHGAVESWSGAYRGKRVVVTGWVNRIHTAVAAIVPDAWAAALAYNVMGPARRREDAR